MSAEHLHRALAALAPAGRRFYNDQAGPDPVAPWVVGSLQMPESILAETGSHGGVARWMVTVAGSTAAEARVIASQCLAAWSGARVEVSGWRAGELRHRGSTGPYLAGLTATDTNLRFQVVRLDFALTVSQIP